MFVVFVVVVAIAVAVAVAVAAAVVVFVVIVAVVVVVVFIVVVVVVANDRLEDAASCNISSGGSGLLQMVIWKNQPLENDHLDSVATCK